MTRNIEQNTCLEAKTACSVVVVYEDAAAREQAVDFCDQLVKRFWARIEMEVNWWPFDLLRNEPTAVAAAEKAARADLVVLCSPRQEDFPAWVKGWIERWLIRRGEREGILAGLVDPDVALSNAEAPKHQYLRQAAHRGAMDYLTRLPQSISRLIPESLESYSQRAGQVSSVLDEILHHQAPPPRLS